MASDLRQSNGRVAEIQNVLIENLDKLGLKTTATQIGNAQGRPDDIMGKGSSRAMEELVILAQMHHGVATGKITRNYTNGDAGGYDTNTTKMVFDYMREKGVSESDIVAFKENFESLDQVTSGHDHSVFDQAYVQNQIDIQSTIQSVAEDENKPKPKRKADSDPEAAPTVEPKIHTIKGGEYLGKIAQDYGVSVPEIIKANTGYYKDIENKPHLIHPGKTLRIPGQEPSQTAEATATTTDASVDNSEDSPDAWPDIPMTRVIEPAEDKIIAAATVKISDNFEFEIVHETDNGVIFFDSWHNGTEEQAQQYVTENIDSITTQIRADIARYIEGGMSPSEIKATLNGAIISGKHQSGPDGFTTMGDTPYKDIGPEGDEIQMRLNSIALQELEKIEVQLPENSLQAKARVNDELLAEIASIDRLPVPETIAYELKVNENGQLMLISDPGDFITLQDRSPKQAQQLIVEAYKEAIYPHGMVTPDMDMMEKIRQNADGILLYQVADLDDPIEFSIGHIQSENGYRTMDQEALAQFDDGLEQSSVAQVKDDDSYRIAVNNGRLELTGNDERFLYDIIDDPQAAIDIVVSALQEYAKNGGDVSSLNLDGMISVGNPASEEDGIQLAVVDLDVKARKQFLAEQNEQELTGRFTAAATGNPEDSNGQDPATPTLHKSGQDLKI